MFVWDPAKAALNLSDHAVPFEFAVAVFDDPLRIEFDASHEQDNEPRRKCVGRIGDKLFVVVFTMRGQVRRIISARRTNSKEDRRYAARSQDES